jgi:acetyl esterase/lipase
MLPSANAGEEETMGLGRAMLGAAAGAMLLSGCIILSKSETVPPAQAAPAARITAGMPDASPVATAVSGVTIRRDVVYGHKDGMALVYDVISPQRPNGSAVLYMVSGGWFSRWAPPESRVAQFQPLLDAGITVIPVHHGSAPRYKVPEAHADVKRALRHVSLNAASYGVDPGRLGVFGGSAGGHLSLMLGLDGDDGDPAAQDPVLRGPARAKAVVAYYPPVDLRQITGPNERFPALDFPNDQAAGISPILFVDGKDPATLIVHGDADELVPIASGQSIHDALKKAGVRTEMVVIKGGDHGFTDAGHREEAGKAMAAWFKANL